MKNNIQSLVFPYRLLAIATSIYSAGTSTIFLDIISSYILFILLISFLINLYCSKLIILDCSKLLFVSITYFNLFISILIVSLFDLFSLYVLPLIINFIGYKLKQLKCKTFLTFLLPTMSLLGY